MAIDATRCAVVDSPLTDIRALIVHTARRGDAERQNRNHHHPELRHLRPSFFFRLSGFLAAHPAPSFAALNLPYFEVLSSAGF
jgi:hypothetical protein